VASRNEQARRMGWLCDQVTKTGSYAVADFICPTEETRILFDADLIVMGAYTQSRIRQMILGGVTRHAVSQAECPLLLAR